MVTVPTPREVLESLDTVLDDEHKWMKHDEIYWNDFQSHTVSCLVGSARLAIAELIYTDTYMKDVIRGERTPKTKLCELLLHQDYSFVSMLGYSTGTGLSKRSPYAQLATQVLDLLYRGLEVAHPNIFKYFDDDYSDYDLEDQENEIEHQLEVVINFNDAPGTRYPMVKDVIGAAIKLAIQQEETA